MMKLHAALSAKNWNVCNCSPGNVVWLDDVTSSRVLLNTSHMPDPEETAKRSQTKHDDPEEHKGVPELCVV